MIERKCEYCGKTVLRQRAKRGTICDDCRAEYHRQAARRWYYNLKPCFCGKRTRSRYCPYHMKLYIAGILPLYDGDGIGSFA